MASARGIRRRSHEFELIDQVQVEGVELRTMLRELEAINRYLGGAAASIGEAVSRLRGRDRVEVLDVGSGGGEFLRGMRPVLDRHGVRHRLIGLDRSLPTCREATRLTRVDSDPGSARSDGPVFASADAFRLPFADRSFDLVHAALFLHHFREPDIGRLLGEMLRVARLGVLINDLHRNLLALYGIRALTALFSRSRYIRNDAPLSVRRGFRRAELMELWQRAGLPSPSIRWRWAFRWMLWTPAARAGVPPAQPEGASR